MSQPNVPGLPDERANYTAAVALLEACARASREPVCAQYWHKPGWWGAQGEWRKLYPAGAAERSYAPGDMSLPVLYANTDAAIAALGSAPGNWRVVGWNTGTVYAEGANGDWPGRTRPRRRTIFDV